MCVSQPQRLKTLVVLLDYTASCRLEKNVSCSDIAAESYDLLHLINHTVYCPTVPFLEQIQHFLISIVTYLLS